MPAADTCPSHVPLWLAPPARLTDAEIAKTTVYWSSPGDTLRFPAPAADLPGLLRDVPEIELSPCESGCCGPIVYATPTDMHALAFTIQILAAPGDPVVEQVGRLGAAQGPRTSVSAPAGHWARRNAAGPGWVLEPWEAVVVAQHLLAAGTLPPLYLSSFLAP